MGFDLGSSQSKTSSRTATNSGPVTASGGSASSNLQFGGTGNQSASNGSIVLGKNASLGSTVISGKGAVVNITTTDNGAFAQAQSAIERIVKGQADNVAAALGSLGNIAETRGTDGANLSAGVASTATKGIFGAAIVGALLLVVVLFLKAPLNLMQVPVVFIQEAPTKMQGTSFDLGAGEKRRFPGGLLGRHRKQIIVTNEDNSDKLYISMGDPESATATGKARAMTIFPNTSITIFTSDDVTLFNPAAAATVSTVQVIEIFYTGAGLLVV